MSNPGLHTCLASAVPVRRTTDMEGTLATLYEGYILTFVAHILFGGKGSSVGV
jgi:hypothetical protein